MSKMDEQILVAPRTAVFDYEELTFQGVNSKSDDINAIIQNMSESYSVMQRGDAEEDEQYKQPIPYAVLKRGEQVFIYERLNGGGETRLHNQLSLGVGGHVNYYNSSNFSYMLELNLQRELEEELYISSTNNTVRTIGLINDDLNRVGLVHLGILSIIELKENTTVEVREIEQLRGEWVDISDLNDTGIYDKLESWSQFVADILTKPE